MEVQERKIWMRSSVGRFLNCIFLVSMHHIALSLKYLHCESMNAMIVIVNVCSI